MGLLTHDDLVELLNLLIDKLAVGGADGVEIRVVGGAAIMLAHDPDRGLTRDVDALGARGQALVEAAAAEIADERGLPPDWLNFKVAMYAPDPDRPEPAFDVLIERAGVTISVGSPRLLLAMKLHAGRGRRDIADIDLLLDACGVRTAAEAVSIFEAHYGAEVMKERSRVHLAARFEAT